MFRGRDSGRGRGRGNENVPLKGLFDDGVWKCNCDPRLPAEHFQTKNGGKNHGRWFYTCQKTQPRRCNFFLWDDEAKPREASAILNNSRSEPHTPPKTFAPTNETDEPITPYTPSKISSSISPSAIRPSQQSTQDTNKDPFEWSDSENEEVSKVFDQISMPPPPETPRKAIKTDMLASPSKRRYDEIARTTPTSDKDDVFSTPSTGVRGRNLFSPAGLLSPDITPTKPHDKPRPPEDSELAFEILDNLRDMHVDLDMETITVIKAICNRQMLKMQGIAKGRDISRQVIKTKEAKIAELQGKIAGLEAERETNRAVIRHLRRDMAELKA